MDLAASAAALPLQIAWAMFKSRLADRLENHIGLEEVREQLVDQLDRLKQDLDILRSKELLAAIDHLESAFLVEKGHTNNTDFGRGKASEKLARRSALLAEKGLTTTDSGKSSEESDSGKSSRPGHAWSEWFFEEALRNARVAMGVVPDIEGKISATKASITAAYHIHCHDRRIAKQVCQKYLRDLYSLPEVHTLLEESQPGQERRTSVGKRVKALIPGQRRKSEVAAKSIATISDYVLTAEPWDLNDEVREEMPSAKYLSKGTWPWDIVLQQEPTALKRHRGAVRGLAVATYNCKAPLRWVLMTVSDDKTMRAWSVDVDTGKSQHVTKVRTLPQDAFSFLLRGGPDILFTGHASGRISVWEVDVSQLGHPDYKPRLRNALEGHPHKVIALAVDISKERLYSAAASETVINCWDIRCEADMVGCLPSLEEHKRAVTSLAISGNRLFSASKDLTVKVWLLGSRFSGCIQTLKNYGEPVTVIKICNPKMFLMAGAQIHVCTIETSGPVEELFTIGNPRSATCLAVSREKMFCGTRDGGVDCWDLRHKQAQFVGSLSAKLGEVTALLLDGSALFAACGEAVQCWWLPG